MLTRLLRRSPLPSVLLKASPFKPSLAVPKSTELRWLHETQHLKTNPPLTNARLLTNRTAKTAAEQLHAQGYAHVRLGAAASLIDMQAAAAPLMGLADPAAGGRYNGAGGVTRPTLGASLWSDAGVGAYKQLPIQFHNEMAYASSFPKMVAFAMVKQAESDGDTLLCDNVQLTALLSAQLRRQMADGVRYVRILHPEASRGQADFYSSWEGAFQTDDLGTAVARAGAAGGALEALPSGRRLRHTVWAPVFHGHPKYGELYFSSILNRHGSWLDGHAHFGQLPLAERPYHCVWADGAELSDAEIAEIYDVHERSTQRLQLAEGDVVVIDNLRVAHGRTPWSGTGRTMGLLLSELVEREAHRQPPAAFFAWAAAAHGGGLPAVRH